MSLPTVSYHASHNIFMRMMVFAKEGDTIFPHKHDFAHLTILSKGKVKGTINGVETIYEAPAMIETPENVLHFFEALEAGAVLSCVHAFRNAENEDIVGWDDNHDDIKILASKG